MATVVTVVSGASVSSAATLPRGDRPLAIVVASHVAREWRASFSHDGGTTWAAHRRTDGTGLLHTVASGAGPMVGVIEHPPAKLVRIEVGSLVATTSVQLVELNRA